MSQTSEPGDLSRELIAKSEAMLQETESLVERNNKFFEKELGGLDREAASRYLDSDKVSAENREKTLAELAAFQDEVERDVKDAIVQHRQEQSGPKPKIKAGKQMI